MRKNNAFPYHTKFCCFSNIQRFINSPKCGVKICSTRSARACVFLAEDGAFLFDDVVTMMVCKWRKLLQISPPQKTSYFNGIILTRLISIKVRTFSAKQYFIFFTAGAVYCCVVNYVLSALTFVCPHISHRTLATMLWRCHHWAKIQILIAQWVILSFYCQFHFPNKKTTTHRAIEKIIYATSSLDFSFIHLFRVYFLLFFQFCFY